MKQSVTYVNKQNLTQDTKTERQLEIEIKIQRKMIMGLTSEMSNMKSVFTTKHEIITKHLE